MTTQTIHRPSPKPGSEGLDGSDVILRRDGIFPSQASEAVSALVHHLGGLRHVLLQNPQSCQCPQHLRLRPPDVGVHRKHQAPRISRPVWLQICPPRPILLTIHLLPILHEVEMLLDFEAGSADHSQVLLHGRGPGSTISMEMLTHELLMLRILCIPAVYCDVLHGNQATAWLQQLEGLRESLCAVLTVEGGLHVERCVIRVLLQPLDIEVVLQGKVAALLHEGRQLRGDLPATLDLVRVDRKACHVGACGPDNTSHRAADPTANVEHPVHVANSQLLRHKVLRVGDGLGEGLPRAAEAKMEGISPTVLVELVCQIVE
mmetsp:Transcript_74215/g.191475  ORF Transcript_74215/g.191475 Transcript_74215/m.191475 type:complete len:318 (+) Transcript_74215:123-1076(+)